MITIIHTLCQSISSILQKHYYDTPSLYQIKQLGETLYQSEEYDQAYRLFAGLEQLKSDHLHTSQRYQIRCLVKLGKTEQAIKKCQLILQQSPYNASWYLLTAEIYLQDQQYTLAWQLLKKSCLWISNHHPQWEELMLQERLALEGTRLHQYQDQEEGPIKRKHHDPHSSKKRKIDNDNNDNDDNCLIQRVLPYDIMCNIFMMLPFDSLIKSIRVCHQWKDIILQSPLLWQQLVFHNCKVPMHHHTIQLYLSRLQSASLLTFHIDKAFDGESLLLLLSKVNCHQLHTLDLSSLQCTTDFSFALFRKLLTSAGKTLKRLRIGSSGFKLNGIIEHISHHCPQLETLDVYDCFTSMGNYAIPLQLDQNALYRMEQFGESFSDAFMEYIDQLPILPIRYLYLSGIHGLTTIHLATILLRCPHLIQLTLDKCLINLIPIINLLRFSCPHLETLFYHRNRFTQFPLTNATATNATTSTSTSDHHHHHHHHQDTLSNRQHQNKSYSFLNRPHRLPMKLLSPPPSSSSSPNNDHTIRTTTTTTNTTTMLNNNKNNNNETSFWKQLSLISSRTLTNDLLHFILKGSYHTIEILNIKENPRLTDDCLYQMVHQQQQQQQSSSQQNYPYMMNNIPALPKLKEFNLSNCTHVTEKGLCAFLKECPQLESIDLSGLSSAVTDQVLYTMAIYCQQLTHLYLNQCKSITDQGIKQLIHIFLQRKRSFSSSSTALFHRVELNKTNISMECLGHVMCFIQQDGI